MGTTRVKTQQIGDGEVNTVDLADGAVTQAKLAPNVPDHGTLGGLSDDDHSQYALLAGRSGGQTLKGGTGAGDNLVLESTNNATKGIIQGKDHLLGQKSFALDNAIAVSLTAVGNNVNATNIDNAGVLTITSDAAYDVTGITKSTITGRILHVHNIGSYNLTFKANNSNSTTAYQFDFPGDIVLPPKCMLTIRHDGTKWHLVSMHGTNGTNLLTGTIPTARLGSGTANNSRFLRGDQTWATPVLNDYISGYQLSNNGSDANNDIDFGAGQCADSTNSVMYSGSAKTKQLDASWAAGTNAGGLDTGSKANSTVYHCFAILKDSDLSVDYLFSLSATSPTMPAGYTYFRRLGGIITNSSGNILAFNQYGDEFLLATGVLDVNVSNQGTSATLRTLTVITGVKVWAIVVSFFGTAVTLLSSPDQGDEAPSGTIWSNQGAVGPGTPCLIRTNTSGQIRTRADRVSTTVQLRTIGWIDLRGKN